MSSQHAVIIGGSSGIGLATARQLLASGLQVTITGRSEQRLDEARKTLGGGKSLVMDGAATATLREAFSRIDAFDHLVLALGSGKGLRPLRLGEPRRCSPGLRGEGLSSFRGRPGSASLPAQGWQHHLHLVRLGSRRDAGNGGDQRGERCRRLPRADPRRRAEAAAGERRVARRHRHAVVGLLPAEQRSAVFAEYAGKTPVGRVGKPEDIAKAIAFLVEDGFMSGHNILCDGGPRWAS